MKRAFIFIALCCALMSARSAEIIDVHSNAVFTDFASSYWQLNTLSHYIMSARYLYWPTNHIHCYADHRGAGSIQEANENRLERMGLPQWANGDQWWAQIYVDNNGGYDYLTSWQNFSNSFRAPGMLFNGTTYTNEHGWAEAHAGQIHWRAGGAIPFNGHYLTGSDEQVRDQAAIDAGGAMAYGSIPLFYQLNFNAGWSNDIVNGTNLRHSGDGEHPGPPGAVGYAIENEKQELDTNVNTCILSLADATVVLTQHSAVSGATYSSGVFSCTWKADRHSMPFDIPDGTVTNDCSPAFVMQPAYSNAFYEVIVFTNCPAGLWQVSMDGSNLVTFVSSGPTSVFNLNLFALTKGPVWNQRKNVLRLVRIRGYIDPVTLLAIGSGGNHIGELGYDNDSQGWWNLGHRGDQLIADLAPNITALNADDNDIYEAATPTNHLLMATLIAPPKHAPLHR